MTMLVNDVAVLLSLHEVAAGGPAIKKGGWGARGEGAAPPLAMRSMLLVVVCVRLLLLLWSDTMLSFKKPSFVAFVALLLLPFSNVVSDGPPMGLSKIIR